MAIRTNVLVVGGGPAGATAARRLADSGIDVLLVEKDLSHDKACGGGIPSTAFQELGIPLDIPHRSINKLRIISPSDRRLEIELRGGSLLIIDRREFDAALRGLAADAGTQVVNGSFLDLESKGKSLRSSISLDGRRETVESDYIIASDGVNSRVKKALGYKPAAHLFTTSAALNGVETDACEFWYSSEHSPNCYSWVFPKQSHPSFSSASHVGTGGEFSAESTEFLGRFLKRLGVNDKENVNFRGYKIPLWRNKTYNRDNILFAGDSAGQVMPFTLEGIYYAMKSGEFAAEAAMNGKPSLYRKLWQERFLSRFRLMRLIGKSFLKSDARLELLFDLFSRPDVQEASMKLWLRKDGSSSSLLSYAQYFNPFLHK